MAKNFAELRAGMSAESKTASVAEHNCLVDEMSRLQLRKAREQTRQKIADELLLGPGDVSELERHADGLCRRTRQLPSGRRCGSGDSRGVSRWTRG